VAFRNLLRLYVVKIRVERVQVRNYVFCTAYVSLLRCILLGFFFIGGFDLSADVVEVVSTCCYLLHDYLVKLSCPKLNYAIFSFSRKLCVSRTYRGSVEIRDDMYNLKYIYF